MLTASGGVIATIRKAAGGRRYLMPPRVRIDWDLDGYGSSSSIDEVTGKLVGLTIDREVATDLPDAVKQVETGQINATLTLTIGKGSTYRGLLSTAQYWSDKNTASALFGKEREQRPIKVTWQFITTSGVEEVDAFTGYTTGIVVDRNGDVQITAEDNGALLRGAVDLPMVVADDQSPGAGTKPNLTGGWMIDWLLRNKAGRYASPPQHATCRWLQTMHGSAQPEVGSPGSIYSVDFDPPNFDDGGFVQRLIFGGNTTARCQGTSDGAFRVDSTRKLAIQLWLEQTSTAAGGRGILMVTGTSNQGVSLFVNSSGNLAAYVKAGASGPHIINSTLAMGTGTRKFVGLYLTFGVNTCTGEFRLDGTSQSISTPGGFNNASGNVACDNVNVGRAFIDTTPTIKEWHGYVDNVQLWEPTTTPTWDNGFTPDAFLDPSRNFLFATPTPRADDAQEAVTNIAAAEFGAFLWDEAGDPYFLTREHLDDSPYDTSQRTLTTSTAIKDTLRTRREVPSVRNDITIRAQPVQVLADTDVWGLTVQQIVLAASGGTTTYNGKTYSDTRTFHVKFDTLVANLDTSVAYAGSSWPAAPGTGSRYRANTKRDGSGSAVSNLAWTITALGDGAIVQVSNPNASVVWVVQSSSISGIPAGDVGKPAFVLNGTPVSFDQGSESGSSTVNTRLEITVEDAASKAEFGEQHLDVPDSPWRQELTSIEAVADQLLADLKDPTTFLDDVSLVGDPLLQLLDRITLQDPDGLELDEDFRLWRLQTTWNAPDEAEGQGVLSQVAGVRSVA